MKKLILINFLVLSNLVLGQSTINDAKKFQFGVNYGLNYDDDTNFNNPLIATASYSIINLEPINLRLGIRGFYQSSKINNINDGFTINPLVIGSYDKIKDFQFYLAIGYYYRKNTFNFDQINFNNDDPAFTNKSIEIKTSGITATIGAKYFVISNLFFDLNYTYLNLNENLNSNSYQKNDYSLSTLNFGVGVAF